MNKKHKNLATEILPRALWVVMVACLYFGQRRAGSPPNPTANLFLPYLGIPLVVIGFSFWIYVGYHMRRALFDKSLVTTGPFAYLRHPMYVGIYLMLFGLGILFFSKIWFITMLVFVPIWYFTCKIEERQMTELHGRKYLEYKKRTGMFLPRITKGDEK